MGPIDGQEICRGTPRSHSSDSDLSDERTSLRHRSLTAVAAPSGRLRVRQRLGKYRIERRLAEGGFAAVYQAYDTIEGIRVALKIPTASFADAPSLDLFRREVRLTARLEHPNVCSIKDASIIDGRFVICTKLAQCSLSERLQRRISTTTALAYTDQMLEGLAHAHSKGILHCDIKPDNVLIFDDNHIRLTDFGIARVARRTVQASGSGTLGSMAPEQAMGKPSLRSDVFALGLVIHRLFAGNTPAWPFDWPFPNYRRLTEKLPMSMVAMLKKSLEVAPRRRYRDAVAMLEAFRKIEPDIERRLKELRRRRSTAANSRRKRSTKGRRRKR